MRDAPSPAAFLRRLLHRFFALFRSRRMDEEMTEEMRLHMELQAEEHVREGMNPAEAMLQARREFGHLDGISEVCRDERGLLWISQLGQDLRYGLRMLRRTPGFTVAAVLTLALGIGVNTGVLSLVDDILLRQMPVVKPGELVLFRWASKTGLPVPTGGSWEDDPVTKETTCTSFSMSAYEEFRKGNQTLGGLFAFTNFSGITVVADGSAEIVRLAELVSGDCFGTLGLRPAAGRMIGPDDDRAGAAPVAVASYGYWNRSFGGDFPPDGKAITVNGTAVTIVGVAPMNFSGTLQVGDAPDLYLPLSHARDLGADSHGLLSDPRKFWWVQIMGRRLPGTTLTQVRENFDGIFRRSTLESLAAVGAPAEPMEKLPTLRAEPGGQGMTELRHRYRQQWSILAALSATILAIACANIASLLLARGASRQREIGVRLAIGANRGRIVRQLLTESALLAAFGGALAVPLAFWTEEALVRMQPTFEGHTLALAIHMDPGVFALAAALAVFTGILFGVLPSLRATRVDINVEFQGGTANRGGGSRSPAGKILLSFQVALSLVLLVGAGLFARTIGNLQGVALGIKPEGLLLFHVYPNPAGSDFEKGARMDSRIAQRLRLLPGVHSVTFSKLPLISGDGWNTRIGVPGLPPSAGRPDFAMVNSVGSDFFSTYDLPIILGRGLDLRDENRASVVAVINHTLAAEYFGDADPVGRIIEDQDDAGKPVPIEVVGVARDAKYDSVRSQIPPTIYFPFSYSRATNSAEATFAIRVSGNPESLVSSIREVAHGVDPFMPIADVRTQQAQINELSSNERLLTWLSGFFSLLAVGLVSLGLYGLMSHTVLRRTGEIGLRMALGATAQGVLWMVMRESLIAVGVGVVIGLAGSFAATRIVANLLFGLTATDPLTFAGGAFLLIVVALVAGWVPARRASRVDPMVALRRD
jgi:predicted permease